MGGGGGGGGVKQGGVRRRNIEFERGRRGRERGGGDGRKREVEGGKENMNEENRG